MKCIFLTGLIPLLAAVPVGLGHANGRRAAPEQTLRRGLSGVALPTEPAPAAFRAILMDSHTPGGVITVENCDSEQGKAVRVEGPTLGRALQSIVRGDENFRWTISNGVVNLLPRAGIPALLKTQLQSFDSGDAADIETAGTLLFALPAVREAAANLGLKQGVWTSGLGSFVPGKRASVKAPLGVHVSHVTLLDALNEIVRKAGNGMWHYSERHCNGGRSFHLAYSE